MPPAPVQLPHPRRTRIKICGVRTAEMARLAVEAGTDAVGVVFAEKSPRLVTVAEARAVVAALPAFVEAIALFVDAPAAVIRRVCASAGIHTVQLHGHESAGDVAQLADLRVIKAVNVGDASQAFWLNSAAPSNVAALLVDAPAKPQAMGGGGEVFDWSALKAVDRAKLPPLILAGGLTSENVGAAIAAVAPFAVDVSSGVESSRGVKDPARINAFCDAVRHADAARL